MTQSVSLDPERQKQAKVYARIERRLTIADMLFGGVYALAWLVFGWAVGLQRILETQTANPWLLVPLFALVFGGIYFLTGLPLSYYSGFVLPHRFGQSVETLRGWIGDQLKSLLISLPIGFILLEIVYALLRAAPDTWWLWVAIVLLAFQVLLANLAPVLIMPLFYKFIPLGEEYAGLSARLMRLAERAHTRVQGVYQFDMSRRTKSANAALTGLGSTRRIILGDTLLKEFSEDEIETVLAHELGHHVHRDIPIGIAVETVITLLGLFLAAQVLNLGSGLAGLAGPADPASLPLLALVFGLYGVITMPLTNAYLRYRERRADEYALEATANGSAFASALTRLANQNLAEADPERWVEVMFYSHPALSKRIAMAQGAGVNK
jgi:STE24 endopeptidase